VGSVGTGNRGLKLVCYWLYLPLTHISQHIWLEMHKEVVYRVRLVYIVCEDVGAKLIAALLSRHRKVSECHVDRSNNHPGSYNDGISI
jgi:hypothetical protein